MKIFKVTYLILYTFVVIIIIMIIIAPYSSFEQKKTHPHRENINPFPPQFRPKKEKKHISLHSYYLYYILYNTKCVRYLQCSIDKKYEIFIHIKFCWGALPKRYGIYIQLWLIYKLRIFEQNQKKGKKLNKRKYTFNPIENRCLIWILYVYNMCIYTRVHNIFFLLVWKKKYMRKSIIGESYFEGFLLKHKKKNFYPTFQPKHNLHKTADFLFTCDSFFFVVYFQKEEVISR